MYTGRQHIQTESIKDERMKKNLSMDTEMGKAHLDMSRTKFPAMEKQKHLAEREMYKELNSSCPSQERKRNQCNITFGSTVVN